MIWQTLGMLAIDATVQGALLLALAALVAAALPRRTAAATRHVVWGVGLLALLAVAALAPLPARWQPLATRAPHTPDATVESLAGGGQRLVIDPWTSTPRTDARAADAAPRRGAPEPAAIADTTIVPTAASTSVDPIAPTNAARAFGILGSVWATGALLSLLPLVVGLFAARRLAGRAAPMPEERRAELRTLVPGTPWFERVRFLVTPAARVPMTLGLLRPVVLLPETFADWPPQRQRAVLLHELAHVRRADALTRMIARCAVALHWWNPLAWFAERRFHFAGECACDDAALRAKVASADYAGDLLAIARELREPAPRAVLAMVGRSHLERRIRAVLDSRASRRGLGARARWLAGGAALVVAVPCAGIGVARSVDHAVPAPRSEHQDPVQAGGVQTAIDAAPPGSTVRIAAGAHQEHLVITKSITLEGAGPDRTEFTCAYVNPIAEDIELQQQLSAAWAAAKPEEQEAVRSRFVREHGPRAVLVIRGAGDVVVKGLRMSLPGTGNPDAFLPGAIVAIEDSTVRMADCAIVGSPGSGIDIRGDTTVEISSSLVAGVEATGIQVVGKLPRVTIRDCDLRSCRYSGITVGRDNDATSIVGCRISGSQWHGIRYDDSAPVISGNRIFDNTRTGIYVSGKTRGMVTGNLLVGNAIVCFFDAQDTFERNTFAAQQQSAIAINGAAVPQIRHNLFYDVPLAVSVSDVAPREGRADDPSQHASGTVDLEGNGFCRVPQKAQWTPPGQTEPQALAASAERDNRVLAAVPPFAAPESGDYALPADSELRRTGIGAGALPAAASPWRLQPEEAPVAAIKAREKAVMDDRVATTAALQRAKGWSDDLAQVDDPRLRDAALAAVRDALRNGNPTDQHAALHALVVNYGVELDRKPLRELILPLCTKLSGDAQVQAFYALRQCDPTPEDRALLLRALADPTPAMAEAGPHLVASYSKQVIDEEAASVLLRLFESKEVRRMGLSGISGASLPAVMQTWLLHVARDPQERHRIIWFGLSMLPNKNHEVVQYLIDMAGPPSEDQRRALWGLQLGVAPEDRGLVADMAIRLFTASGNDSMRAELARLINTQADAAQLPALRALAADEQVPEHLRAQLRTTIASIEAR